jgi:hypothetical protein
MVTNKPSEYDTLAQEVAQWAQAQSASWRNHAFRTDSLLSPTSKAEYELVFDPCSFSFEKAVQVLSEVVNNRRRHLRILTRKSESLCPLDGRYLEYNCQETTFSCTPQERTDGFFDELDIPSWDFWVGLRMCGSRAVLHSWIPAQFIPIVSRGVESSAEKNILWLDGGATAWPPE